MWRTRRASLIVLSGVLVLGIGMVILLAREKTHSDAVEECSLTPPGTEHLSRFTVHARWEWKPPGYICVYTNRAGVTVAERRP